MSYPTTARRRLARASMAAAIACALLAGTAFAAIPSKGPAAAPPPAGTTVDRAAIADRRRGTRTTATDA